jgi:hypothetical protein
VARRTGAAENVAALPPFPALRDWRIVRRRRQARVRSAGAISARSRRSEKSKSSLVSRSFGHEESRDRPPPHRLIEQSHGPACVVASQRAQDRAKL